jgi:4-diphosphocytidyl-2-C-methyl-D-erythritol kinase
LAGLNAAWKLGLADATLAAMAAELGSDVPFFLRGGTALGEGRGERLTLLAPLPTRALILGIPKGRLLTAEVYGALAAPLTPGNGGVTVSRFFGKLAERNDFALATNDLEAPAFSIRRELVAFRDALLEVGAEVALLSGSGSTVFGVFRPGANVASVVSTLRRSYPEWTLRETRTIASGVRVETAECE